MQMSILLFACTMFLIREPGLAYRSMPSYVMLYTAMVPVHSHSECTEPRGVTIICIIFLATSDGVKI